MSESAITWTSWAPATCQPDRCFCEAQHPGLIAQPANAVSSLAFCVVALVVLRHRSQLGLAAAWRFALALTFVGLGSAFFHASLTLAGQTVDVLGMYLVATWFLVEMLAERAGWTARTRSAVYMASNAALLALLVSAPALRRYAFAALLVAVVWRAGERRGLFLPAVAVLAGAFTIWTLDLTRLWCAPDSIWQGHALWHVGGAAASWLAYTAYVRAPRTNQP